MNSFFSCGRDAIDHSSWSHSKKCLYNLLELLPCISIYSLEGIPAGWSTWTNAEI